ncbi:hypothetical protein B0H34DRAFT_726356 [Crassisporium funariophilum]|nr:hypothetical protein B0H34DRAFT_726356 [Crassisporium funariophilum]
MFDFALQPPASICVCLCVSRPLHNSFTTASATTEKHGKAVFLQLCGTLYSGSRPSKGGLSFYLVCPPSIGQPPPPHEAAATSTAGIAPNPRPCSQDSTQEPTERPSKVARVETNNARPNPTGSGAPNTP